LAHRWEDLRPQTRNASDSASLRTEASQRNERAWRVAPAPDRSFTSGESLVEGSCGNVRREESAPAPAMFPAAQPRRRDSAKPASAPPTSAIDVGSGTVVWAGLAVIAPSVNLRTLLQLLHS
jgi:hypothetical protein